MKIYLTILSVLTLLIFSQTSCEKVIDIDLNESDVKYVVEGIVNKDSLIHTVKITKTQNFDEATDFPTVDNALVTITDNLGNSVTLTFISNGIYQTSNYLGVEGRIYTINVTVDGKTFSAASTMPYNIPIDSLTLEEFSFGPTPVSYLIANRIDSAGIKNYYNFNLFKNGDLISGIFLQDDQFADGVEILQPIFGGDYESGDTAVLEMMCIDANVYKYFYTLSINAGGTGGAVPANPESNFGSSCLGYFSAQTFQRKSIIVL